MPAQSSLRRNRISSFLQALFRGRGKRSSRNRRERMPVAAECLEERTLLTSTLFLDFGAGIGAGNTLTTDVASFRDIFGAGQPGGNGLLGTGADMADGSTLNGSNSLELSPLSYSNLTWLQNAVVPIVQRVLEPFDIDVVVGAATSLADVVTAVGANVGDSSGQFDAYVFIMDIKSDGYTAFEGSVGDNFFGDERRLFGRAAAEDLNAQTGNNQDEAVLVFADTIMRNTEGYGVAPFNPLFVGPLPYPTFYGFQYGLAQSIAYTAAHEAMHTFSLVHTVDAAASGDVIRTGSNTRTDPFMVTRFDLNRENDYPVSEPNNYLFLANDTDIGLRDSNANGIPDLAYVTGTGLHDEIILTNAGNGNVTVSVNAYNDSDRTDLEAWDSYTINLATDTDGVILIDGGVNNDKIVIDPSIAATIRVRGGGGTDPVSGVEVSVDEADELTFHGSTSLAGVNTPNLNFIDYDELRHPVSGTIDFAGNAVVTYEEIELQDFTATLSDLTLRVVGSDEDDLIRVFARDSSTDAGADGVQDFEVGVNSAQFYSLPVPSTWSYRLFLNYETLVIDMLDGDDDAVQIVDTAPNGANWDVDVTVVGSVQPPKILGPIGDIYDVTPTLSWEAVIGAATYDVEIRDRDNNQVVFSQNGISGTSLTLQSPLPLGDRYRLFVRSVTAGADASESRFEDFDVEYLSRPTITSPTSTTSDDAPTIEWTAVDGAVAYNVEVYDSATEQLLFSQYGVSGTSVTVGSAFTRGFKYRAEVRGVTDEGLLGLVREKVFHVKLVAPSITSPNAVTLDFTPTITWDALANAVRYSVKLIKTSNGQIISYSTQVTGTSYNISTTLTAGVDYQVQVAGVSAAGILGDVGIVNFEVTRLAAPNITSPTASTYDLTPTITWDALAGAASYEVEIYDTSTQQLVLSDTVSSGTSFTVPTNLAAGVTYEVVVAGVTNEGAVGNPGSVEFDVMSLATPSITSQTATTDNTPTITWDTVAGAATYYLELYNVDTGQPVLTQGNISGTAFTVPTSLFYENEHRVYVRAVTAEGVNGNYGIQDFDVKLAPISITSPLTTIDNTPTITWNAVTGAASYYLELYNVTTGQPVLTQGGIAGTSFTAPSSLVHGNKYKVYVRGVTAQGDSGDYSFQTFDILLLPPGITSPTTTIDTTPTITWGALTNAATYYVEIYDLAAGQQVVAQGGITGTSFTAPNLSPVKNYSVYVRGVTADGVSGYFSIQTFTVTLAAAVITSPGATTSDTTPTIAWNAVAGASKYDLFLYDTVSGQEVFTQSNISSTSFTLLTALTTGSYKVYVRGVTAAGGLGTFGFKDFSIV